MHATRAPLAGRIVRGVLAACFAAIAGGANAAAIDWHVRHVDRALDIDASALLRADLSSAWRVLTDYARYAQFIPGLRASHVVARHGPDVVVAQSVDVTLWLFRAPVDVTYAITEQPPARVESRTISGCACTLDSTYTLTRAGGEVRLDYRGRLVTGSGIVSLLGNAAGEQTAKKQFRALADEIEAQARAPAKAPALHVAK